MSSHHPLSHQTCSEIKGTYGVVTSVITKAYDPVPMGFSNVIFTTAKLSRYVPTVSNESFWTGIRTYLKWGPQICDAGGIGYNFIRPGPNGTLTFTSSLSLPGLNYTQGTAFTSTLFEELNDAGVNIINPYATLTVTRAGASEIEEIISAASAYPSRGPGEMNTRLASRLFPRENFEDDDLLDSTVSAIRSFVAHGGYTFHGVNHCPTMDVAGNPNNAVNPAYRRAAIHAQGWDSAPAIGPISEQKARKERFDKYFQPWRDVSPGAGSYMGEADPSEPNWQQSFYGDNYDRLLGIKKTVDPWGLFWVMTGVGSEGWEVRNSNAGWPSQNVSVFQFVLCEAIYFPIEGSILTAIFLTGTTVPSQIIGAKLARLQGFVTELGWWPRIQGTRGNCSKAKSLKKFNFFTKKINLSDFSLASDFTLITRSLDVAPATAQSLLIERIFAADLQ